MASVIGRPAVSPACNCATRFPAARLEANDDRLREWVATVTGFIETPGDVLKLPLDIQGTVFQRRVWKALQSIPVGRTASYRDVAVAIGQPAAHRAVASACAANKLAVAIPCHRVVRTDGKLGGYRWGLERKRRLLANEQADGNRGELDSD
jgi:AraC family transcriptional regulator of adaptative response/methylated-DNA-[protein]-cysteine methyltransferase